MRLRLEQYENNELVRYSGSCEWMFNDRLDISVINNVFRNMYLEICILFFAMLIYMHWLLILISNW